MRIINNGPLDSVKITEIKVHPRNPRKGDVEVIRESMRENGFYGAVVVQRSTGYILVGNHRYEAACKEGAETVPVVWLDVDDDRAMKILLADNKTNDMAKYDEQALLDILSDVASLADSLKGTGWTESDLEFMCATKTDSLDKPEDIVSGFVDLGTKSDKDDVTSSVDPHVSSKIFVPDVPEKIFTPKLDPVIEDKRYYAEDVSKKKEELDSAFTKSKSKLLTLICPECGNAFFVDKESIK